MSEQSHVMIIADGNEAWTSALTGASLTETAADPFAYLGTGSWLVNFPNECTFTWSFMPVKEGGLNQPYLRVETIDSMDGTTLTERTSTQPFSR